VPPTTASGLNGLIFLALLEKWLLT
jgi:hypothetical protein